MLWTVVVGGVLAYAVTLLVPSWYQLQGERLLVVTSGSMAPRFVEGDVVVLRSVRDASELKPGLIVTFQPVGGTSLVTHRIVSLHRLPAMQDDGTGRMEPVLDGSGEPVLQPYLRTQGDANPEPDPNATPLERVRGVLLRVHHGWGDTLVWATSSAGRAVMLVPPLLALATLEVLSVLDARRRRRTRGGRRTADDRRVDALLLD
ncbi:signal peptidase I [Cellulomonas shaoxiangyii]|uniref:Signal peptidase I n=1 Tax=Cellulomonas shaoxiangyii TaxID=2566013 RepID=A0A4P7SPD8_9CELL|nr:signal peptidase I [Cellulomonas shaoxiangyii]TGY84105.1 signal peptidase I [Cellulomonas shaoxiangyii]